jgi:uncharacterized YigZ family protein
MLFEDTYLTIESSSESIFKDKGSKFLAYAYQLESEKQVKDIISALKKTHVGARHFCYAYVLGADKSCYRANDDGEPSYTAGKPILGQIRSKDLTNVLIVVVRYFGGTLLGVSGLINAYKNAAANAIEQAVIIEKTVEELFELSFKYDILNDVMKVLKDEQAKIIDQEFSDSCIIKFSIRKNQAIKAEKNLKNILGLSIKNLI